MQRALGIRVCRPCSAASVPTAWQQEERGRKGADVTSPTGDSAEEKVAASQMAANAPSRSGETHSGGIARKEACGRRDMPLTGGGGWGGARAVSDSGSLLLALRRRRLPSARGEAASRKEQSVRGSRLHQSPPPRPPPGSRAAAPRWEGRGRLRQGPGVSERTRRRSRAACAASDGILRI